MKIRVDKEANVTPEELEDLKDREETGLIKEASHEEFAEMMKNTKEIVISEQVAEFLKKEGISIDEFTAMILKTGNKLQ